MNKLTFKTIYLGFLFSIGFCGGVFLLTKAASLTATTGTPLTATNWNDMVSNFFWGSGTGGIYYNGKVGIGTNVPNRNLHVYDTTNNAEIDLQSVAGINKHWGIYQNAITQNLHMRNISDRVIITTGGNLNVGGTVNAGGTLNAAGGLCMNGDCKTAWSQLGTSFISSYTGTCDSSHRGATGIISGYYKICNGTLWLPLLFLDNYFVGAGSSTDPYRGITESSTASIVVATSCQYYNLNATTLPAGATRGTGTCGNGSQACLPNGIYRIDPDGFGGTDSLNVYCDMTTDAGGWTLVVKSDNTTHAITRSSSAGGLVGNNGPTTDCVGGGDQKLSDTQIAQIWTTQIRMSTQLCSYVAYGIDGTPLNNLKTRSPSTFSDQCTNSKGFDWTYRGTNFYASYGNTHTYDCGWTAYINSVGGEGPYLFLTHESYKTLDGGGSGAGCGCGYGWVK